MQERTDLKSTRKTGLALTVMVIMLLVSGLPYTRKVEAAAGDLDMSFGSGGKVTTHLSSANGIDDEIKAVALQNDGKIVVAGYSLFRFALARYNPDGSLDTSFGTSGIVTTSFAPNTVARASAIALQSDGKIIAAGFAGEEFALARYNGDGSLDTNFDLDGKVTTSFSDSLDAANAVAIQNDGKIIAAGQTPNGVSAALGGTNDIALARYHPDGSLDMSFDNDGMVTTGIDAEDEFASAIVLQSDGKLVVAGAATFNSVIFSGKYDFLVARYHSNGSLDNSFNGDGITTTRSFDSNEIVNAATLQSDGKIIAAGYAIINGLPVFGLARFNSDGSLDVGFGSGGKVFTDFTAFGEIAYAVALQNDGRIVAAGNSGPDFGLARYNGDGSLDLSFDLDGKVITSFSAPADRANAVAIQNDGMIIAAGYATGVGSDFGLARYQANNFTHCLQTDFGGNLFLLDSNTGAYLFTTCSGLSLSGTGRMVVRGSNISVEHNTVDRRVVAKLDTSQRRGTASVQLFSPAKVFSISDQNTANNSCSCH